MTHLDEILDLVIKIEDMVNQPELSESALKNLKISEGTEALEIVGRAFDYVQIYADQIRDVCYQVEADD